MSTKPLNEFGHFSNGVCSSFSMLCLMQPVFTTKTYVMEKKGFPPFNALYKGFGANCAGVLPAQGIAFLTYGAALKLLSKDHQPTNSDKLTASIAGGVASAPVAAAFERIMILQQLANKKNSFIKAVAVAFYAAEKKDLITFKKITYMHLPETIPHKIFKQDGAKGFIKGLVPTIKRDTIFLVGLLSLYDLTEEQLEKVISYKKIREMVAGFGVGAVVGFITTPADLVKTRMQADFKGSYSVVQTTKHVVRTTMAKEFFKGAATRSFLTGGAIALMVQAKQILPAYLPERMHQK